MQAATIKIDNKSVPGAWELEQNTVELFDSRQITSFVFFFINSDDNQKVDEPFQDIKTHQAGNLIEKDVAKIYLHIYIAVPFKLVTSPSLFIHELKIRITASH